MPNRDNLTRPVCLVGLGRSGTTLITNIFRRHPDFQSLGETANLVFSTYYHIEKSLPITGPRNAERSDQIAARDCVYKILLDLYASRRPLWFQKPILVPSVISMSRQNIAEFGTWYWSASHTLFPEGRFFTVMREPADVLKSSMIRWGWSFDHGVATLRRVYALLLHPDSRVTLAMPFADLQREPEASVAQLLAFSGAAFDERCMAAFNRPHAPNPPQREVQLGEIPEDILTSYAEILQRHPPVQAEV